MVNSLQLSEALAYGGRLTASESGWDVTYYFPGPDRRYNGTFFKIDSTMLQQYVEAWKSNWLTFSSLSISTKGVDFSCDGALGMKIGRYGIWLYGLNVASETELAAMLDSLTIAMSRGAELQQEVLSRVGHIGLTLDVKLERFSRFKAGETFGISTNPSVVRELIQALALVRSKFKIEITSCRHRVTDWFGKQAADEFMEDIRRHGLDVFCEQADFVITWRGQG